MARSEFKIERAFLERLERLTLNWAKSFRGVVGGHNPSRFSGPGQEFLDHRNFTSGDDLRAVNWRAYMRLEKLFLKLFQIEPRVPIRLLLDASESMALDGKWDYARRLTAAILYVGMVRLEAIQLIPFRDGLEEGISCGGGRHQFPRVSDALVELEARGQSDLEKVVRALLSAERSKGLLIVVSDFQGEKDWLKPLQYLADYGYELTLIQIWSEEERRPRVAGELELTDVETGQRLELTFDEAAQARYTEAFDAYAEELKRLALRSQGRYAGLETSMNVEEAVFGALVAAQGMR